MNILKPCAIALALSTLSHGVWAESPSHHRESATHHFGEISTKGLEALLNSNESFSLIDARTQEHFDHTVIPGARWLPADAYDEVIAETLPHKNQLVVVYCAGEGCPASKNLAKRLIEKGYTNVVDYNGGINEWDARHQPTEQVQD